MNIQPILNLFIVSETFWNNLNTTYLQPIYLSRAKRVTLNSLIYQPKYNLFATYFFVASKASDPKFINLSTCIQPCFNLFIPPTHPSVHPATRPPSHPATHPPTQPPTHPHTYLSIYLSIYPYILTA